MNARPFMPRAAIDAFAPALTSGDMLTRLPRLLSLAPEAAEEYWNRLLRAGARQPYGPPHPRHGQLEQQYGTAVDISPSLATYLCGAVRALDRLTKRYIREAGGLTAWLEGRAPSFGGVPLNFEAVNRPLERLLEDPDPARRITLPFSLDPILTIRDGKPTLSVVELQTGFGYARMLWLQLEALGYDPNAPICWCGSAPPAAVLAGVRRTLAGGEDISLLAAFPSSSRELPDEVGWARFFSRDGPPGSYFLATDLERDGEGWYHFEYEIDPVTGFPMLDGEDRPVRHQPKRKRRIRRVITNQNQIEIDEIHDRLDPEQRARFLEFLEDAETVDWLFPHAAWYIADKSLMGRFRADLLAEGSPYADLFVPCFSTGERIDVPGVYVKKPIRGVGGLGIEEATVSAGEALTVPEGFVVQERFQPYPLPVHLPEQLAGAFPVPDGAAFAAVSRVNPCFTTATVELRVFSMPGSTEARDACLLMARVAPTWDPAEVAPRAPVLTNLTKIQQALWNSPRVCRDNYKLVPFGWCVVTVGATDGGAGSRSISS